MFDSLGVTYASWTSDGLASLQRYNQAHCLFGNVLNVNSLTMVFNEVPSLAASPAINISSLSGMDTTFEVSQASWWKSLLDLLRAAGPEASAWPVEFCTVLWRPGLSRYRGWVRTRHFSRLLHGEAFGYFAHHLLGVDGAAFSMEAVRCIEWIFCQLNCVCLDLNQTCKTKKIEYS